ncbi:hypothetical protein TUM4261_34470 [Shewanella sp. c952]|uniref:hypothetical protein n=1 Tax=Shewanella sp. c952 TaxID=2815913 RepID=UPI001BBCD3B1|nr:hypothetical protein [Shewanella sp. c952]GIU16216.1 hypothetical protein TUM4261_34470 [Shewanella sp. c952]
MTKLSSNLTTGMDTKQAVNKGFFVEIIWPAVPNTECGIRSSWCFFELFIK